MATRPLFSTLRTAVKAPLSGALRTKPSITTYPLSTPFIPSNRYRLFHNSLSDFAAAPPAGGTITNANTSNIQTGTMPTSTPLEYDTKHAAFLGEADSDDAFNALHEINPPKHEPMDGTNSAYLGEADSDDGFEAHGHIHGRPHEPMDVKHSAFLGEADSDDAFEARRDEVGESDHGIHDSTPSAFHGESGEQDGHDETHKK